MGSRREAREETLKVLYQIDIRKENPEQIMKEFWKENPPEKKVKQYSRLLIRQTLEHLDQIDSIIKETSSHWKIDRIGLVELNILRFAICEILYKKDIPSKVAIDEAVAIAKDFGTDDSGSFINGILDRVMKDSISRQLT